MFSIACRFMVLFYFYFILSLWRFSMLKCYYISLILFFCSFAYIDLNFMIGHICWMGGKWAKISSIILWKLILINNFMLNLIMISSNEKWVEELTVLVNLGWKVLIHLQLNCIYKLLGEYCCIYTCIWF